MLDEEKIAGKKRRRLLVEDAEVGIRMRGGPGPQDEAPRAQIQHHFRLDEKRRGNRLHLIDELIPHRAAEGRPIIIHAGRHRGRQSSMADELRSLLEKGRVAEHVIGMIMRVDDVANGFVRDRPDGGP